MRDCLLFGWVEASSCRSSINKDTVGKESKNHES